MRYNLSELCDIIGGGTPKTNIPQYWGGNIPWLSVKDFNNDRKYVYEAEKAITEEGLNNSAATTLIKGDIIISARGTVGEMAVIPYPMSFNQSCYGLRAKKEIVDADYLYYLVKFKVKELKHNAHGSVFDTITRDTFEGIEVDIPSKVNQQKIASILAALDSKIETNETINHNLEQQAFALFDYLFPNISDGLCTIGDYITPKRGRNLLSKDAVPGTVPVVAGGLEPSTYHNIANTLAPVLTISASGANAGFVNLWHKPVWSSDSSFIDSSMTKDVYFWFVMLKKRQREIFDAQTGSAQPHIYPQHIAAMTIRSLDQALMSNFTSQVTPLFALIGANKDENDRLTSVRDALLPKLISGEIDVSEIEV